MQIPLAKKIVGMALFLAPISLFVALSISLPAQAQDEGKDTEKKQDTKKPLTKLHVKVTAGDEAAPVQAAQVDVTSEEEGVSFHKIVRTDHDGKADLDVPRGKVLVQVTAPHWDIGGTRCKLKDQDEQVEIKLVRRKQIAG